MDTSNNETKVSKNSMDRNRNILIILVVTTLLAIVGFVLLSSNNTPVQMNVEEKSDISTLCQNAGGKWLENTMECENVDQNFCRENNGNYNDCASACRHSTDPEVVCTTECIRICTFFKDDQKNEVAMPSDYTIIVKSSNDEQSYTQSAYEDETAFDILNKLKMENKIEFEYTTFDFGVMVDSINGVKADSKKEFWQLLVNGKPSNVGVSDYKIKEGDILSFELTQF